MFYNPQPNKIIYFSSRKIKNSNLPSCGYQLSTGQKLRFLKKSCNAQCTWDTPMPFFVHNLYYPCIYKHETWICKHAQLENAIARLSKLCDATHTVTKAKLKAMMGITGRYSSQFSLTKLASLHEISLLLFGITACDWLL